MIASFLTPEWIMQPMRAALDWFHTATGSYGFAIILLTISVRIVILPLTLYQTKAMKRMQEVQPLMKEVQAKYKDNPQKLNEEMMKLYKHHGANPFASCLPTIIQMPFLFALFTVLRSPDMHGANESFLWMANLADKDIILAVLTAGSMFLQSYLTTLAADPNQKMMTYMMPLLFGWLSYSMPAGVTLYWVVSTLFGLGQQAIYPGFPRLKTAGAGSKGDGGAR